jgi:hypothetical protein
MAKKVVATLKSKDKGPAMAKLIRAVKNERTGSYSFKSEIMPADKVQDFLANNK